MGTTAAQLLRNARQYAEISQEALAERTGVTPSVVQAFESGRSKPSLLLLASMLEECGQHLDLSASID